MPTTMFNYAGKLKRILRESAESYAHKTGVPCFRSTGSQTVIFEPFADGMRHGNFFNPSFRAILANEEWRQKLHKVHSSVSAFGDRQGVKEMDSSNSSDALLMNIFCDPELNKTKVQRFFGLAREPTFTFAFEVAVKRSPAGRPTEVDLALGDEVLIEAKLTEGSFTERETEIVEAYTDLEKTFDTTALPRRGTMNKYVSYQLIRNVLAAEQTGRRAWLAVDARRPDLVKAWVVIMNAIKDPRVRRRCGICFWQELVEEIAAGELQSFV